MYIHIHMHTYTYTCMRQCANKRTHTYMHTHTHTTDLLSLNATERNLADPHRQGVPLHEATLRSQPLVDLNSRAKATCINRMMQAKWFLRGTKWFLRGIKWFLRGTKWFLRGTKWFLRGAKWFLRGAYFPPGSDRAVRERVSKVIHVFTHYYAL